MAKLPRHIGFPPTLNNLHQNIELMAKALDANIDFGPDMTNSTHSDIYAWRATGTTANVANTEFSISHNLTHHVPIMFIGFIDQAGNLYSYYGGMTAWTKATKAGNDGKIFLKCTAASANYRVIIF